MRTRRFATPMGIVLSAALALTFAPLCTPVAAAAPSDPAPFAHMSMNDVVRVLEDPSGSIDDSASHENTQAIAEALKAEFNRLPQEIFQSESAYEAFRARHQKAQANSGDSVMRPMGFWDDAATCGAGIAGVAINVLPWGQFLKLARVIANVGKVVKLLKAAKKVFPIYKAKYGVKRGFVEALKHGLVHIGEKGLGQYLLKELLGINLEALSVCVLLITGKHQILN